VQPDGLFWGRQAKTDVTAPDRLSYRQFARICFKFFLKKVWLIGSADITFAAPNEQELIITKSFQKGF
jgi:hypothetical protein